MDLLLLFQFFRLRVKLQTQECGVRRSEPGDHRKAFRHNVRTKLLVWRPRHGQSKSIAVMKALMPALQAAGIKGRLAAACRKGRTALYIGQICPMTDAGAGAAPNCLIEALYFSRSRREKAASICS